MSERRPQLMADVSGEPLECAMRSLDPLQQPVQGLRQFGHFDHTGWRCRTPA